MVKKDQKISELNNHIVDLNSRLNQLLNDYKNMEFDLQRRQKTENDLNSRIKQFESGTNAQYQELAKNYEINQRQLNNALAEISKCKNIIVPELEAELRRRDAIIAELQDIIRQLENRQTGVDQNNLKLR